MLDKFTQRQRDNRRIARKSMTVPKTIITSANASPPEVNSNILLTILGSDEPIIADITLARTSSNDGVCLYKGFRRDNVYSVSRFSV